jgi:putative FmdB family regulatory protein
MPTYVYECRKCGHRFEEFQSISDPPRKRCPQCRSGVRRVVTPGGGLVFKGSGFYITDYRTQEYREKASREASEGAGGGSDSAGSPGPTGGESGCSGAGNESSGGSSSSGEGAKKKKKTKDEK